ncbi:MAG: mandelate racemase/muconate lactonizing enzyme family protein [Leptospiraceae bacterium]|nr:mandelate racemase/muconate lactonizing enzyme family protein [Leptospiraceae bacterium]
MIINEIELFYVKVPLAQSKPGFFAERHGFFPSWIPGFHQTEMRMYVLRLRTDSGLEGIAGMPAMGTERTGLGPLLGNYLLGLNPLDIAMVNQRIQEFSYIGMRNGWIDAAFWDIIGKARGQSLHQLLGGQGGFVYPYASTGATHNHNPEVARDLIRSHQENGYRGTKLRVKSRELQPMVEYVQAARESAGPEYHIMVDANQGWPVDIIDETPRWDVDFALQYARAIESADVYWLEEPLNRGNLEGLAELRRQTSTPIAGGEMNSSHRDFQNMIALGSLDVYQPDAVLVGGTYAGGISVVYWLLQKIRTHNQQHPADKIKFCPHTWTTGIGFAVNLQMVGLVQPEERSLLEYPLEGYWRPEYWGSIIEGDVFPDRDGRIRIPEEPGLGVRLNKRTLRRFGRRVYHGTSGSVARFTLRDRGLKETLYLKKKKAEQAERFQRADFQIPAPPF